MHRRYLFVFLTVEVVTGASGLAAPRAAEPPAVEICTADGAVIVADRDIKSYDWTTHTFTLAPNPDGTPSAPQWPSGGKFTLVVNGEEIYSGEITSSMSCRSVAGPVILRDENIIYPKRAPNQFCIQLGYPSAAFADEADPRADERLRAALEAANKLIVDPTDHVAWIDRSLREMQTIKVGMTRAQLLDVFVEEGGLSNRLNRRYAFRECPYFKVDVRFEAVGSANGANAESPDDKIASVSQPLLEWSIGD